MKTEWYTSESNMMANFLMTYISSTLLLTLVTRDREKKENNNEKWEWKGSYQILSTLYWIYVRLNINILNAQKYVSCINCLSNELFYSFKISSVAEMINSKLITCKIHVLWNLNLLKETPLFLDAYYKCINRIYVSSYYDNLVKFEMFISG